MRRLRIWLIRKIAGNWNVAIDTRPTDEIRGCLWIDCYCTTATTVSWNAT